MSNDRNESKDAKYPRPLYGGVTPEVPSLKENLNVGQKVRTR